MTVIEEDDVVFHWQLLRLGPDWTSSLQPTYLQWYLFAEHSGG